MASERETLITVENLSKVYRMGGEDIYALRDVDLTVHNGEYLSVMGPSGSGKSTLFNMIGALDTPTQGDIHVAGVELTKLSSRQLSYFRCHHIGYIFQAYNLIPSLTAVRNVMMPLIFAGLEHDAAEKRAAEVLDELGLGHRLHHRPDELSGGQQQRVAIARALANEPAILLADEPTANLDLHTGEDIIKLLGTLCRTHGVTVICATHDHQMLNQSDRICWIKAGRVDRLERRADIEIRVGSIQDKLAERLAEQNETQS